MDRERLYGDAKATARAGDTQRKERTLATAEAAHEVEQTAETKTDLARALFEVGQYKRAEKLLTELLEDAKGDIQLTCDIAFVYKNMDETERAKEMFRNVMAIDIKHPLARCAENELWVLDPSYRPSWMRAAE